MPRIFSNVAKDGIVEDVSFSVGTNGDKIGARECIVPILQTN